MTEIESLLKSYYNWLQDKTTWEELENWTELTVPFLDRHNDYMQIYLKKEKNGFLLTDGGETIGGLVQEGCSLDSPKRQSILEVTLNGYGVRKKDDELQVTAKPDDFAWRKHSLVQAMLAVNDMFYMATSYVASIFSEDVGKWLDIASIRYTEGVIFQSRSGYNRNFNFVIPRSNKAPERIIKTINNPEKTSVDSAIMDWLDTKDVRKDDSKAYVFLNDNEKNITNHVAAFQAYEIKPVPWTQRDQVKDELAA